MIASTRGGNLEVRSTLVPEWGTSVVPPPGTGWSYGGVSWAGRLVPDADALALVAVASCIRLLSQQIACMPFTVYTGPKANREPAPDSWQEELLDDPSPDWSSFDFISDIVSSLESTQHAFVQKVKPSKLRTGQPGVVELRPLDPDFCAVKVVDGQKTITWWDGSKTTDATSQILHIRGWVAKPGFTGPSTIRMHSNALGSSIALNEYSGRYFQNDARPSGIISSPGNLNAEQRKQLREGWDDSHQGASSAHGVGILWGGAAFSPITPALKDTQAVELWESCLREACRMFGIPDMFLGAVQKAGNQTPEAEFARLFRLALLPRCRRIEPAFKRDPDLFAGSGLGPRFDPTEILRADTATTALVIQELVQVGVLTANEGRSMLGLAPDKTADADGVVQADVLLQTPVGAGANPALSAAAGLNGADPSAALAAITPGGGDE